MNPTKTKCSLNKQKQALYLYRVEMQKNCLQDFDVHTRAYAEGLRQWIGIIIQQVAMLPQNFRLQMLAILKAYCVDLVFWISRE